MTNVFGLKSIIENLEFPNIKIKNIYIASNTNQQLINILNSKKIKFNIVEKSFFNKFDKELNHQFCFAEIKTFNKYYSLDEYLEKNKINDNSTIVILDEINDPRNFGSIIRTSYALGVDCIIYKKNNQVQINDLVAKTSLGSSNLLNLVRETNLSRVIEKLKDLGYWIYSSALNDKAQEYTKVNYYEKKVLIIGNESNGISLNLLKKSDFIIKIPMKNNFNSLNASVAFGILLSFMSK